MTRLMEINLLNTHYYLLPEDKLGFFHSPHATICPEVVRLLLEEKNPTRFITPHSHFLHCIEYPSDAVKETMFKPIFSYLETSSVSMITELVQGEYTSILEWLQKYWKEPFLLTHPYYHIHGNSSLYLFSSKHAAALPLTTEMDLYDTAIENGCYSVGNGLLLALSMVALGKWKEKEFLQSMTLLLNTYTPLDSTLPFYIPLDGVWNAYIEPFPYHLVDHIFAYAFHQNTPAIYRFFYSLCKNEELLVCHVTQHLPAIFISSVFTDLQRKDQYLFVEEHIHALKKCYREIGVFFNTSFLQLHFAQRIYRILRHTSLYKLLMQKKNPILRQFAFYIHLQKDMGVLQLAKMFLAFDSLYPSRRLFSILERLMELCPQKLLKGAYYVFLQNILFKKSNKAHLAPSRKLIRTLMFRNPSFTYVTPFRMAFSLPTEQLHHVALPYQVLVPQDVQTKITLNTTWKAMFQWIDTEFEKTYHVMCNKRILRKFLHIKRVTQHHPQKDLLQFLMDDYYRTRPEELWK